MKRILAAVAFTLASVWALRLHSTSGQAIAMGEEKHAIVDAKASQNPDGSFLFVFKLTTKEGMAFNFDAPWKGKIIAHQGLRLEKTDLDVKDFEQTLIGYRVRTIGKPEVSKGKLEYSLIVFTCTADKTKCFREVHDGSVDWGA